MAQEMAVAWMSMALLFWIAWVGVDNLKDIAKTLHEIKLLLATKREN